MGAEGADGGESLRTWEQEACPTAAFPTLREPSQDPTWLDPLEGTRERNLGISSFTLAHTVLGGWQATCPVPRVHAGPKNW